MGAGGIAGKAGLPGPGGQAAGRPMTPFSIDRGGGGMQGANTGMGYGGYGGMQEGFTQSGAMSGMSPYKSVSAPPQQMNMGNLGQMASLLQGGGQMPQGQVGNLSQMASLLQGGGQFPQSLMPYQQSQGMAPQAPVTQSPMQQGLGGLGAYMGGGGGGGGA